MSRITAENGGNLAFSTGSSATERMRVTSGGSLAINTQTSPIEKVTLHDGNIRLSGTDDARIQFLNSPTASYALNASGGAAIRFHRPSSGHEAIAFETHDTGVAHAERMRIHRRLCHDALHADCGNAGHRHEQLSNNNNVWVECLKK